MTEPIPQIMVCPLSLEQAKQKSELEVWLYSRMANLQCKEALAQVQQHDLHSEQGQALLRRRPRPAARARPASRAASRGCGR